MPVKPITIYGMDGCNWCVRACTYLAQRGYTYDYRNMSDNPALQEEFTSRTNGAKSVPQIFIGDELIGGFDALSALSMPALQAKVAGA